jgi:hypothetical protein
LEKARAAISGIIGSGKTQSLNEAFRDMKDARNKSGRNPTTLLKSRERIRMRAMGNMFW